VSSKVAHALVWLAFFATSVYGHAALKLAVDTRKTPLDAALSPWGLSAFVAWTLSAVLWMLVLEKHSLLAASTISSLRYVLICLSAWTFWRGPVTVRDVVGVGLVTAGVYLVAR
jgi:uncharacterized membrane protein